MTFRPMRRRLWLRGPRPKQRPHRMERKKRSGNHFLLSAIIGIGLALLAIYAFDSSTRPVVETMAQAKVQNTVTALVNDAVAETLSAEAVAYSDIVTVQKDAGGRITAMSTSTPKMNTLRTELLGKIVEQVDSLDTAELGIPLGNLTGFASASGRGPMLPIRVVSVAAADAKFENVFTAAGINQTLHQIMIDVSVTIEVLIPGGAIESVVDAQVPVVETVIVGEVPDAYLQFGASAGSGGGSYGTNTTLPAADASSGAFGGSGLSSAPSAPPPPLESLWTL